MTEVLHPALKAIIKKKLPVRLARIEKAQAQIDFMELSAPFNPAPTNDAEKAEQHREQYLKAIQGCSLAQFDLAFRYVDGQDIEKNEEKAAYWFKKAAIQGDLLAQYNLGLRYRKGLGVEKSEKKAAYWLTRCAIQGDALAQYHLGLMYRNGRGVEKDNHEAAFWFYVSARQGDVEAQREFATTILTLDAPFLYWQRQ